MNFEFDESKLLYGLGGFLGVLAIVYFGHELVLDLSPTIKSFILLSATAMFLGAGEYVEHVVTRSAFYIFSAFSYLSFLTYIFARFSFGSTQIFIILAGSSAAFLTLGYLRNEKEYQLTEEQSKKLLGVIAASLAIAIIFDVTGARPEYKLQFEESIEVKEGEEFQLGVLEVRNDFFFSRNLDIPKFNGCIALSEGERHAEGLYINPENEGIIGGMETMSYELTDTVRFRPDSNASVSGNYTLERSECPSNPEKGKIYISEGEGFERIASVVRD